MSLEIKIECNGIKPLKSAVYLLAAELAETERLKYFSEAVISALKSYDYADYYDYSDYDDYDYYAYDYYYDYDYDYAYYYYYDDYSISEKVIALLFLSAMHAAKGK